nr:hypothetical protein [Brachybacterium massiliense]
MRDEHHGQRRIALTEREQQVDDPRLHGDIESGGGLVEHQRGGGEDQRPRDRDALTLPAREPADPPRGGRLVDPHPCQQLEGPGAGGGATGPGDPQRLGDQVHHLPSRVERCERVLVHQLQRGGVRGHDRRPVRARRAREWSGVKASLEHRLGR